jgi:C-terminal processing protease CtpA/Prc
MKKTSLFLLLFTLIINGITQVNLHNINTIDKEQKIYELSMIWKEVSYNFDNFDNCPGLDIDSLYRAFIPIIQNTENDWDYVMAIQRFMAHFNNGHTSVSDYPKSVDSIISFMYVNTIYKNGKIIIDNMVERYSEQLHPNDEIITINGKPVLDFLFQEYIPYIPTSNKEDKIHLASLSQQIFPVGTEFTFGINDSQETKNVTLTTINSFSERWYVRDLSLAKNMFFADTIQKIAYIKLVSCSQESSEYFQSCISEINSCSTLILDLSHNGGGQSTYNDLIYKYLIQKDSIEAYQYSTRYHRPLFKGSGKDHCNETIKNDLRNDYWCSFYNGTFFTTPATWNFSGKKAIDTTTNFKGKVFVLIGRDVMSAGEDVVTMLSQDEKIIFLGGKTNGATGRPYLVELPSGLKVMINTAKTYDFQGNDISTGFPPDYEVDFYDCYKTTEPQQLIDCLMNKINSALSR